MLKVREDIELDFSSFSMMQLPDIAETICARALGCARKPAACYRYKHKLQELLQYPTFLRKFKMNLTKGMVDLLAAGDERILAAYLFELSPDQLARAEVDSSTAEGTHLLLHVRKGSADLDLMVEALDQALAREVRKLAPSLLNRDESLLNAISITDTDVKQRKGPAMLLSSTFVPVLVILRPGK